MNTRAGVSGAAKARAGRAAIEAAVKARRIGFLRWITFVVQ
jgi:hypothetical protein